MILPQSLAQLAQHGADALLILAALEITTVEFPNGFAERSGQARFGVGRRRQAGFVKIFRFSNHARDIMFNHNISSMIL